MEKKIFRDTIGDTSYDTDPYDLDSYIFDSKIIRGNERAKLDRTQEDLQKYKQRIDANVEQQKEYSEIMATMQNKVKIYYLKK